MRLTIPGLLFLTGCPYIFGEPDLVDTATDRTGSGLLTGSPSGTAGATPSGTVPSGTAGATPAGTAGGATTGTAGGAPTGTTGGTQTGTAGGTPSGTAGGTVVYNPPVITSAIATLHYDEVWLTVEMTSDDIMEGGVLEIDDGGIPQALLIPYELLNWDPVNKVALVALPTPPSCAPMSLSYTIAAVDRGGRQSVDANTSLDVAYADHSEGNDPTALGALGLPAIVCGSLSNNNDIDTFAFDGVSGSWTFSLHDLSNTPANRDMHLRDAGGTILQSAQTAIDPDTLTHTLTAGATYEVEVFSPVSGSGSDWQVVIHH